MENKPLTAPTLRRRGERVVALLDIVPNGRMLVPKGATGFAVASGLKGEVLVNFGYEFGDVLCRKEEVGECNG